MKSAYYLFFLLLITALSCNKKGDKKNEVVSGRDSLTLANQVKKVPLPIGKIIPCGKPVVKKAVKPHAVPLPAGSEVGYIPMQNYNTEQGLALSSVSCSYTDKAGNIWFGTFGGGVSRYNGATFTNFNTLLGLSDNTIHSIAEDRDGNIWLGTNGRGADCYNGRGFVNYSTDDGLPDNTVRSIITDKKGNIWLGTNGGLCCYDGKNFRSFKEACCTNIRGLFEDRKGNIWLGTYGYGLSYYDGRAFTTYTMANGLPDDIIFSMAEDSLGNIWLGTNAGAVRFDGKAFASVPQLTGQVIRQIYKDKAGTFWFATYGNGVSSYDGKNLYTYTKNSSGLADDHVICITGDKAGNLWFGTFGNGVSRYDGKALSYYTTDWGLVGNHVRSILQDSHGDIWLGTDGSGLSVYDGKSFLNYTVENGLPGNNVWCSLEDAKGNIWLGTYGEGLSCFDGKTFTNYTTRQGLPSNKIMCALKDRKGNLWFGTDTGGIFTINGNTFLQYTTANGLAYNNIWCCTEDSKGHLWFGTFGGGVSRYDGLGFTNFTRAQGLADNTVLCMAEDKAGNLWFGTDGGGICRFDGSSFISYSKAQGLSNGEVYAVRVDKEGNIILGTNLGLSILKGFISVNDSADISGDTSRAAGNVKKLPASCDVPNARLQSSFKPLFEEYNQQNGYQIKDINTNAMLCDNKGVVWAGCGDNRLLRFDYNALYHNAQSPEVYIESIRIDNENISWYDMLPHQKKYNGWERDTDSRMKLRPNIVEEYFLFDAPLTDGGREAMRKRFSGIRFDSISRFNPVPQNLVLPYKYNQITINFSAIDPAKFSLVRFQYMLQGYDKEWTPITDKTSATFGNIHEGNYTFVVRAISPDGTWGKPVSYSFTVLPPWYRTWWAYTAFVLLILGVVRLYIYRREMQLRHKNRLLKDKINEQKRTEEKLKHSELRLRQAQEVAHLGNWELSFATGVARWSEEMLRIYGLPVDEPEQTYESWLASIHPDDKDPVLKVVQQGQRTHSSTAFFHRIKRKDGTVRHIYSQAQPEFDKEGKAVGLYGVAHDVTEMKEAEDALRLSQENLRLIVDLIPQAIFVMDYNGRYVFANRGFAGLFGLAPGDITGRTIKDLVHDSSVADESLHVAREVIDSGISKIDEEMPFTDFAGEQRIFYVIRVPYVMPVDNTKAVLGIALDITREKKEEAERSKMVADIVQRNKNLEQFSYIVSHNLRLPVANIIGLADLLKIETDKDEQSLMMGELSASALKLDNVIKDLNLILQVRNTVKERWETVKFAELLSDVKQSIENVIRQEGVAITADFSAIDDIRTIRSYLYSIFYNLISNSIKYRQPDVPPVIQISSQKKNGMVEIIFSDNGLGIDLARKGHYVFGLYKRFHMHTEGKGMGLYMVKTQVESLGGRITIESEINKGTTFKIDLPDNSRVVEEGTVEVAGLSNA